MLDCLEIAYGQGHLWFLPASQIRCGRKRYRRRCLKPLCRLSEMSCYKGRCKAVSKLHQLVGVYGGLRENVWETEGIQFTSGQKTGYVRDMYSVSVEYPGSISGREIQIVSQNNSKLRIVLFTPQVLALTQIMKDFGTHRNEKSPPKCSKGIFRFSRTNEGQVELSPRRFD